MKQLTSYRPMLGSTMMLVFVACASNAGDHEKSEGSLAAPAKDAAKPMYRQQAYDYRQTPSVSQTQRRELQYPVVLHHGFMGGTKMGSFGDAVGKLGAMGVRVYKAEVSPAHSIQFRAEQLGQQIDRFLADSQTEKINIIAHSMGGLDARYLITNLGYHDRVASLTTLGTPHQGTPLADKVVSQSGPSQRPLLNVLATLLASPMNGSARIAETDVIAAATNLTQTYLQDEFNPQTPDNPAVFYQSYAGVSGPGTGDSLPVIMLPGWMLIKSSAGPNDGVVPEVSARWGIYQGPVPADHIDLVGMTILGSSGINYSQFLETVVAGLEDRGF